ncbi:hypothetical protein SAMN04488084_106104 [Pedobacter antarcticus]|uniref:Uncharacterized protein n=1 Tax=Pedobacter antarcticus TaxID=34086 RepID=A0A1I2EMA7_9SPHI|nr:hypothetical protein SAMN04488084_106104 [Pedobacter antarcticus]SFE94005.1 hypothetical protein SAMN03003324_01896 [Pedobacter antarcticus]
MERIHATIRLPILPDSFRFTIFGRVCGPAEAFTEHSIHKYGRTKIFHGKVKIKISKDGRSGSSTRIAPDGRD